MPRTCRFIHNGDLIWIRQTRLKPDKDTDLWVMPWASWVTRVLLELDLIHWEFQISFNPKNPMEKLYLTFSSNNRNCKLPRYPVQKVVHLHIWTRIRYIYSFRYYWKSIDSFFYRYLSSVDTQDVGIVFPIPTTWFFFALVVFTCKIVKKKSVEIRCIHWSEVTQFRNN